MLGYGIGIPETGSAYGLSDPDEVFKLTHVTCSGTELTLLDCLSRYDFNSKLILCLTIRFTKTLGTVLVFSIQTSSQASKLR